jgi:Putative peptidoglycan binding domain
MVIYMRCVLALMVMATALSAQPPAHPAQAKPKSKSSAPAAARTGVKPAASKKSAGNEAAAAKSKAKSTTQRTHVTASRRLVNGRWVTASRRPSGPPKPVGQQHPEPNRYQEIQKALQERGYFKGEPNGEWNDESSDALKRFQADQKLPNDGKINSLTLIGLGLGPKHEGGPVTPPPPSSLPPATPPPISPETVPAPNKPQ